MTRRKHTSKFKVVLEALSERCTIQELADSTVVPDFTTSDIAGGIVAQLLLEKTYEQAE